MEQETTILSEVTQIQKDKCCMFSFIGRFIYFKLQMFVLQSTKPRRLIRDQERGRKFSRKRKQIIGLKKGILEYRMIKYAFFHFIFFASLSKIRCLKMCRLISGSLIQFHWPAICFHAKTRVFSELQLCSRFEVRDCDASIYND